MKYGNLIKELRTMLGLTQQDLADYTELSLRIIKSVESESGEIVASMNQISISGVQEKICNQEGKDYNHAKRRIGALYYKAYS